MNTKKYTLEQLFALVDGRLSTTIDDVYDMLKHITDEENLFTHHLPVALDYLKWKNPKWFVEVSKDISDIKKKLHTDDFITLLSYIQKNNKEYLIPQLKDEFDTSDFGEYMVGNSLLIKKALAS
jgi:hypothetical protein